MWCGTRPLMEVCPCLFKIVANKEAWIMDYIVDGSGGIYWNIIFYRHFNDWELEVVLNFFHQLYHYMNARFLWKGMIP